MLSTTKRFLTGQVAAASVSNIITNGTFNNSTGWTGIGTNGVSIAGGKLVFAATPNFAGPVSAISPVSGKYYELTYTISGYSAGNVVFFSNGVGSTPRTANGTYTERLLAASSTTDFIIWSTSGSLTASLDDLSYIGPYNTSTVGGA